jgi:serine phosphatase RsbU (regulator of sigma subunit)/CheY-like chemotaxis protein
MSSDKRPFILCVDDEKVILETIERQIAKTTLGSNYVVEFAESGEEAIEILDEIAEDGKELAVIVSDVLMPGMKGDELIIHVHSLFPKAHKILLTGQASLEAITNTINKAKLYRYVSKPWESTDLMLTIEEAARSYAQQEQITAYDAQNRLLKTLNEASQKLSSEMNSQSILQMLAQITSENIETDWVVLFNNADFKPRLEEIITSDITALTKLTETLEHHANQAYDNLWNEAQNVLKRSGQFENAICLPIPVGEALDYYLYLKKEKNFTNVEFETVKMLVSQASISLENSKLYQDLASKNEDIVSSIEYAQRIQFALLPSQSYIDCYLKKSFVYYKPKDIVSGDFFWFADQGDWLYIAAVDCTGHGVPGAFMSMLGYTQLNEIVFQDKGIAPDSILNKLHERVLQHLTRKDLHVVKEDEIADGMDLVLCRFNPKTLELDYAGANRPLFILRKDGNVEEIAPDKYPIGHSTLDEMRGDGFVRTFTCHKLALKPEDEVYLFTDGIVDQFGGPAGKKYGRKSIGELIHHLQSLPFSDRAEYVDMTINEWRGNVAQMDDILFWGFQA